MAIHARSFGVVAVAMIGVGALALSLRRDGSTIPAPPSVAVAIATTAPQRMASYLPEAPQLPVSRAPAEPIAFSLTVPGADDASITSDALAERPSGLEASNRRAWRLTELIERALPADAVVRAWTEDGRDYVLNDGRRPTDVIVVRRSSGELYVGWLDGNANPALPLADAELPAERIERVTRIAVTSPAAEPVLPPAALAIVIDGKLRQTLTATGFAAVPQIRITDGDATITAVDVRSFGANLRAIELTADGAPIALEPPAPDARGAIYLTRRARFKFLWLDAAGAPIAHSKQRDVSRLVLSSGSKLATRR